MDIFEEAQAIRGYEEQSIKAMCLYANLHQSKQERQEIKAAWDGADPKPYARAVDMMPGWFNGSTDASKWELLSLIKIAGVRNKFARALLAEEWRRLTMSYDDVRERADAVNKPKPREKKVKHCPHCDGVLP
jgi:hypothetical protein